MIMNRTKTIFKIFGLALSVILTVGVSSCKKDTTIAYNNVTMGNVVNGRYVSDQGNIFNIVEQNCNGKIDTMTRVYTVCDILNKTAGGAENEYDVRLNYYIEPLCKSALKLSQMTEEQKKEVGSDPISITKAWFSGGYLNLEFYCEFKSGSKVSHFINLVQNDVVTKDGFYVLKLHHNSYGDSSNHEDATGLRLGYGYASFPISSILPAGTEEADIELKWDWYIDNQPGYSPELKESSIKGKYKKDGFEHAPAQKAAVMSLK